MWSWDSLRLHIVNWVNGRSDENAAQSLLAFVLMPFEEEFTIVYDELIVAALEEVGYEAKRADSVIDQRSVLSDIILGINGADLIVADLTELNPNVFYELGIAHGLGIPTVLITQSTDELPFDLRTYRASEYSTRFDEASELKAFLRKVGAQAANGGVKFSSPVSDFLPDGPAAKRLQQAMEREASPPGTQPARSAAERGKTRSEDEDEEEEDGEPGSLDLLHGYVESSQRATGILDKIGSETEAMGSKIQKHTESMQEVIASSKPGSVAQIHRISSDVATDLNAYSSVLKQELPDLEQTSDEMIESGVQWLTRTGEDQDKAEVEGFRLQLAGLYVVIAEAMASMSSYRDSFSEGLGVTSQLDKASNRVTSLLDRLIAVMEKTQSFASRGCDIAQELLNGGELHLVAEPGVVCFADADGSEPQPFSAVLLVTFDRGVAERVLPYGREQLLEKHSEVSWEIDNENRFPRSWYRHPYTGKLEKAWDESPEFVGRQIGGNENSLGEE
jgi:hypothetical protein